MNYHLYLILFFLNFNIFCDIKRPPIKIIDYGYYLNDIEKFERCKKIGGYKEYGLNNDLITLKLNFTRKTKGKIDSEGKKIEEDLDDSEWDYKCQKEFTYNNIKYTLDFELDKINGPQYKILKNNIEVDEKEFKLNNPEKKWILLNIQYNNDTFDYIFCNNLTRYKLIKYYSKKELIEIIKEKENIEVVTDEMINKLEEPKKRKDDCDFYLIHKGFNKYKLKSMEKANKEIKNNLIKKIKVVLCDLENVDNIENLFSNFNVEEIDVSKLNTNNIKKCSYLFNNCENLKNIIGFNNLNFSNVEEISGMFNNCKKLQNIDLSVFKSSNIKILHHLFGKCESLKKIDLRPLNTNNVEKMNCLFYDCKNLEEIIGLENLNVDKVIEVEFMFSNCEKLKNIKLPNFTNKNITHICNMFYNCKELENIENLKCFDGLNNIKFRIDGFLYNCKNLKKIYFPNIKTNNITIFDKCFTGLDFNNGDLDISHWDFSKAENYEEMFMDVKNLKTLKIGKLIFNKNGHGNGYDIKNMFKNAEIEELIITKKWDIPDDLDINTIFKDSKIKKITILEDEKKGKKIDLIYDKKDDLNKFITNPEDYQNNKEQYKEEYLKKLNNSNIINSSNKVSEETKEIVKCCSICGKCNCNCYKNN